MKAGRLLFLLLTLGATSCATTAQPCFQYARDVAVKEALRDGEGKGEVTIVWRYGSPEWVSMMCGGKIGETHVHGCAMRDPGSDRCVMFLVQPRDFQDRDRLAVLGHELWHCTGARHS